MNKIWKRIKIEIDAFKWNFFEFYNYMIEYVPFPIWFLQ